MSGRGTEWDAVVLLQMGGPARLDDIRPFLRRLLADPDIIRFPRPMRPFQPLFARAVARGRTPLVRSRYQAIADTPGAASPIGALTARQAEALSARLGVPVHVCMRYTEPGADHVIAALQADDARDVLVLPLYPHYSGTTTGSSVRDLARAAHRARYTGQLRVVRDWGLASGYLDALEATIAPTGGPDRHLVLSAHGIPESYAKAGDPYVAQVEGTAYALTERLVSRFATIRHGYQSAVGPVQWITPDTTDRLDELAADDADTVVVAPLGFVTDHIETLYDIDIQYRQECHDRGLHFVRAPSLNDHPVFIDALADIVTGPIEPLERAP